MVEFPPHKEISGRPSHGDEVRARQKAECCSGKYSSEETGLKENRGDALMSL